MISRKKHITAAMFTPDGLCIAMLDSQAIKFYNFSMPESLRQNNVADRAAEFQLFLRENSLNVSSVDSLAAADSHIAYQCIELPAVSDPAATDSMVRLACETNFAAEFGQLAISWNSAAAQSDNSKIKISVAACSQANIELWQEFFRLAGLKLQSIKAFGATIARAAGANGLLVLQNESSVTICGCTGGIIESCNLLSGREGESEISNKKFAADLDSTAIRMGSDINSSTDELIYCGDRQLAGQIGAKFALEKLRRFSSQDSSDTRTEMLLRAFVEANTAGERDSLNLQENAISAQKNSSGKFSSRILTIAAVAAVLLAGFGLHWYLLRRDISKFEKRSGEISVQLKQLREKSDSLAASSDYFAKSPWHMDLLLSITEQFPQVGSIYLSDLQISDNYEVSMAGRADSREIVLALVEKMNLSGEFKSVTQHHLRSLNGSRTGVSFSIGCEWNKGGAK